MTVEKVLLYLIAMFGGFLFIALLLIALFK